MTPRFRVPATLFCCLTILIVLGSSPLFAQITFTDFSSTSGLVLNGSATTATNTNGLHVLRLTSDGQFHTSGTAWSSTQQNVAAGFTSIFQFQITHSPNNGSGPADGLAFVIQNSSTSARGGSGGALGYGVPDAGDNGTAIANSLAVEFDTFTNGWDPDGNHIAVQSCGTGANTQNHTALCPSSSPSNLGILNSAGLGVNLADGQVHKVIVEYDPGTVPSAMGTLRVFVDNTAVPKLSVSVNLATLLSLTGSQNAYVGFTGSVGGSTENNDIVNWTFTPAATQTTVTQPLNTTGTSPSTDSVFGSYDHKVLNYFTTNSDVLSVTAIPETQAQYLADLNGQFVGSHCHVYDGTGGLCVKFRVSCTSTGNDCENLEYEITENFNNNNQGNPIITGAGLLKRKTPTGPSDFPTWSNIAESFSQSRYTDPGTKARSTGFSEFVSCSGCTAAPTITASPADGSYATSPATIHFTCVTDPLAPFVTLVPDTGCTATLNDVPVADGTSASLNAVGSSNTLTVSATDTVGNTTNLTSTFVTGQAPMFTSANSATFQPGVLGSFLVTTTGFPTPSISESGSLPSGVTFTDNGNGTATLAGTPTASGTFGIAFTASNGAGSVGQNFTLNVPGPQVSISPSSLNFGNVGLLGLSAKTVTVKNVGSVSLQISGVSETLIQSDWDDFTFVSLCPGTLAPGKSCTIAVVFFADDLGLRTSTLNIFDNGPGGQQQISMTGTAVKRK
jgi:Legume lectin domain/HYDIN/CFA65/VesB-like, Ig-like domain